MKWSERIVITGVVLAGFFLATPFAFASSVNSQLLSDTLFTVNNYPDAYGALVQSVGNVASSTPFSGIYLKFGDTGFAATPVIRLYEYSDEATFRENPYAGGINVGGCNGATLVTDQQGFVLCSVATTTLQGYPYFYGVYVSNDTSGDFTKIWGTTVWTGNTLFGGYASGGAVATTTNSIYYQLIYGAPVQYYTPDPTYSGFATTTVAELCDSNFPAGGSWTDSVGVALTNGLCRVGSFLLVPSQNSLTQFGALRSQLVTKVPFSYIYEVADIVGGVSTTSNTFPSLTLDLEVFATSSVVGTWPSSVDVLSTSTIGTYLTDSVREPLRALIGYALWLAFAAHVFFTVKRKTFANV